MPQAPHIEHHFTGSELVRDIVIGMSDGLTVPFALAAGLSSIANSTAIVITGGLAEIIAAGSIAMGLGGYLAAKSDAEHWIRQRALYRYPALPQRPANSLDRRPGRRGGLWPGKINFEII